MGNGKKNDKQKNKKSDIYRQFSKDTNIFFFKLHFL
jgi:hypothetical protein